MRNVPRCAGHACVVRDDWLRCDAGRESNLLVFEMRWDAGRRSYRIHFKKVRKVGDQDICASHAGVLDMLDRKKIPNYRFSTSKTPSPFTNRYEVPHLTSHSNPIANHPVMSIFANTVKSRRLPRFSCGTQEAFQCRTRSCAHVTQKARSLRRQQSHTQAPNLHRGVFSKRCTADTDCMRHGALSKSSSGKCG